MLDARLRFDARFKRVLDGLHLGHGVGQFNQFGRGVAPGDDHVQRGISSHQHGFHVVPRDATQPNFRVYVNSSSTIMSQSPD